MASQVFENATDILETLRDFDDLVLKGNEQIKNADARTPLSKQNNVNSSLLLHKSNEKLKHLNNLMVEIKRVVSKSNNTLNETSSVRILIQKIT